MITRREFLCGSAMVGAAAVATPLQKIAQGPQNEGPCAVLAGYTRSFPQLAEAPLDSTKEQGLKELGKKMTNEDEQDNDEVTAGYTYLGQFIDHDLTLDITPLPLAHPDVEHIPNFRTPYLNLDHVYAGGPNVSPFLYEMNHPQGHERFLIGMTRETTVKRGSRQERIPSTPDDLPRNGKGIALAGDPRQDENLIIAQLHVAFLKFHNRVMEELEKGNISSVGPANGTVFEQARRLVTWNYQYVVLHDFLNKLLDPDLHKRLMQKVAKPSRPTGNFQLPVEFSAAAFRFGHSMVRDSYNFSEDHEEVSLPCLLALTGIGSQTIPCPELPPPGNGPFALPADWKVQWRRFFIGGTPRPQLNASQKINTRVANGLHHLQPITVALFNAAVANRTKQVAADEDALPVRTLLRGARMGLPTGQRVAEALGETQLNAATEIAPPGGPHTAVLQTYGFDTNTPLWYYILKEAELAKPGLGTRLGKLGSRLIGDTIVSSLQADSCSFVSINPHWEPVLAGTPAGKMSDILQFIGVLDRN